MIERPHGQGRTGRQLHWKALAVLLAGILLTIAFSLKARQTELDSFGMRLEDDSTLRAEVLKSKLNQSLLIAEALRHFFDKEAAIPPPRAGSRLTLPFLEEQREIWAIEWVSRVPSHERPRFEKEGRKAFGPGFGIHEIAPGGERIAAAPGKVHYPVVYVSSQRTTGLPSPGFDAGSDVEQLGAMERATDSGTPAVSGRIGMIGSGGSGFVIACPVYDTKTALATVRERRLSLRGLILVRYRTDLLLLSALNDTEALGLGFELLDLSGPPSNRLLFHWTPRLKERDSLESFLYPAVGFQNLSPPLT